MSEPGHLAAAGQLLALVGQYSQAADLMLGAATMLPEQPTLAGDGQMGPVASDLVLSIRQAAVSYLLAASRENEAAQRARSWLPFVAEGSSQEQFLRLVAAHFPED
jgi:hypothetical protein